MTRIIYQLTAANVGETGMKKLGKVVPFGLCQDTMSIATLLDYCAGDSLMPITYLPIGTRDLLHF